MKIPSYQFTKGKYQALQTELEVLLGKRQELVDELAAARAMGDLSENGRYKSARQNLNDCDRNIRQHQLWLKYGKMIEKKAGAKIHLGDSIEIEINGVRRNITLVGKLEADPALNFISDYSPIGKAIIGHSVGELIQTQTPGGILEIKILAKN